MLVVGWVYDGLCNQCGLDSKGLEILCHGNLRDGVFLIHEVISTNLGARYDPWLLYKTCLNESSS